MKICLVSLSIPAYFRAGDAPVYGGAEVQAAVLARALAAQGVDVTLVVSDLRPGETLPFETQLAFQSDRGLPGFRFFHPRLSGLHGALQRAGADIYYQRNAGLVTGVTALFCKRRGKVFVYGAGSNTDFSFRTPRLHGLRERLLYYTGIKLADGIVAQNRLQEELCRRNLKREARVIPNGVSVDGVEKGDSDGSIVWVGGVRRVKRPDVLLDLAERLPRLKFVLIGGAAGTERTFAKQIAERAASMPNVEATGRIPHTAVLEYVRRAALLVNTSHVEGFPNVYLEAWRSGVPVVSFNDVDGLVAGEALGAICRDTDDMAARIEEIVGNPGEREAMGERAIRVIQTRFSPSVIVGSYLSYFDELLERKRRAKKP